MHTRYLMLLVALAALATIPTSPALSALSFDGQSGVFLNALAYPLKAGSSETSAHTVDLGDLGSIQTYNLAFGLKGNVEVGFTRYSSQVTGVRDQNLVSAKWQFAPESKSAPAVGAWAIHRGLVGGDKTLDLGLTATKILTVGKRPLVLDLGLRSTKALGLGLFGVGSDRELKCEGAIAYFVSSKLIVGTEFKQQIDAQTWRDIALRWVQSDRINIDFGIANFNSTLDSQIALAATYSL